MLSAGNPGASIFLSDALLATFVPAADQVAREQAKKEYARTFKSPSSKTQTKSLEASFKLDNDSLIVSEIRDNGEDVFAGIKKMWGLTMGQYTAAFGSTVRLFPTDLAQTAQMNGKNVTGEVWRLWPEFGEAMESDLPGSRLSYDNCLQWSLGDWVHYGKEPLDRIIFYKDADGHVVGLEMPFLRTGVMKPM